MLRRTFFNRIGAALMGVVVAVYAPGAVTEVSLSYDGFHTLTSAEAGRIFDEILKQSRWHYKGARSIPTGTSVLLLGDELVT